ncbi:hypothetical protein DL766_001805 [Monosporascus sp. MC13-8B]|uniref:3-hydroxyisobutyryl-coenzyme A hydrolase n=1 Tax=Monosporascus cannonballus TaxID=155416 RepID=A0ABY0GVE7_9PEZI|nr:hypothetical protein DL763_011132 [Monosporascus cannonballus]RYO74679.1 hypothetical protein DL762_010329 [Monosporascus cannonballus]RYP36769.1 hypothetical protein DL766_001805 [Monosporascus sp. MC13-8B]
MPSAAGITADLPAGLTDPPPATPYVEVSFPRPHVLLVRLDRPERLNAVPRPLHAALERLWDWYDAQPYLRCAVLTGAGKAFCVGADLKEWDGLNANAAAGSGSKTVKAEITQDGMGKGGVAVRSTTTGTDDPSPGHRDQLPRGGFGGLSNRGGKKPVIAAVNGACLGGGFEMVLNCDLVVASRAAAVFGLPEVGVGVVAVQGALPRLARSLGSRQRALEMALAGRSYDAARMREWGLVNEVVEGDGAAVVEAALRWAERIAANSPDAVIVSREGIKLGCEGVNPEVATDILIKGWYARIEGGQNMVEGVRSFVEKRKPVWKDSKL